MNSEDWKHRRHVRHPTSHARLPHLSRIELEALIEATRRADMPEELRAPLARARSQLVDVLTAMPLDAASRAAERSEPLDDAARAEMQQSEAPASTREPSKAQARALRTLVDRGGRAETSTSTSGRYVDGSCASALVRRGWATETTGWATEDSGPGRVVTITDAGRAALRRYSS